MDHPRNRLWLDADLLRGYLFEPDSFVKQAIETARDEGAEICVSALELAKVHYFAGLEMKTVANKGDAAKDRLADLLTELGHNLTVVPIGEEEVAEAISQKFQGFEKAIQNAAEEAINVQQTGIPDIPSVPAEAPLKVWVDSDILLDHILSRPDGEPYASELFLRSDDGDVELWTSPLVLANVAFVAGKSAQDEGQDPVVFVQENMEKITPRLNIAPIGEQHIAKAIHSRNIDFEDALQIAVAEDVPNLSTIITRNHSDYRSAQIPVRSAQEWIGTFMRQEQLILKESPEPAENPGFGIRETVPEISSRVIKEALRSGKSEDYAEIYNHALTHELKPSALWTAFMAKNPEENLDAVQSHVRERLEALSRETPVAGMGDYREKQSVAVAREWMRSEFAGQPAIDPEVPYVRPSLPKRLYQYRVEDLTKAISVESPRDLIHNEARRLFFLASRTGNPNDFAEVYNHAYSNDLKPSDVWGSVSDVETKESILEKKAGLRELIAHLDKAHPVADISDPTERMRVAEARRWLRDELGGEMSFQPAQDRSIKIKL